MRKLLPTITSHGLSRSTWRDKIKEIKELGLREVALFVTGLSIAERHACFEELKKTLKTHKFSIPFCHSVSNMTDEEYRFLKDTFGTQRFNLHAMRVFPLQVTLSDEIRSNIFIENSGENGLLKHSDLEGFGGVCLDLSHLFDTKIINPETFPEMLSFLDSIYIGANHISAANQKPSISSCGGLHCSNHFASDISQFDYLSEFPARYFSDICALELENPLCEQLIFKARIEEIISGLEEVLPRAA